jgi:hypothetical protein
MIKLVTKRGSDSAFVIQTAGLKSVGHREISVRVLDPGLSGEAEQFLNYVSNYLTSCERQIAPGETLAYGYWLVKFQQEAPDLLETWEYNAESTEFVSGANLTLRYWRDQHLVCKQSGAEFSPPRPDMLTVVSKGVLEGLPVEGVRYPSPDHMSGWWITTNLYDGNPESLIIEHTYHISAARPELARYLALPKGFRFDLTTAESIWRDEKVASAEP